MGIGMSIDWNEVDVALTAVTMVVGAIGWLGRFIRKKLHEQDQVQEKQLAAIESRVLTAFGKHEELDQQRHNDNIRKFERQDSILTDVRLMLARAGLNGHFPHEASTE